MGTSCVFTYCSQHDFMVLTFGFFFHTLCISVTDWFFILISPHTLVFVLVAGSEAGESLDSLYSSVDDDDDMRRGDSLLSSLDLSDNTDPGSVTSIRSGQWHPIIQTLTPTWQVEQ